MTKKFLADDKSGEKNRLIFVMKGAREGGRLLYSEWVDYVCCMLFDFRFFALEHQDYDEYR